MTVGKKGVMKNDEDRETDGEMNNSEDKVEEKKAEAEGKELANQKEDYTSEIDGRRRPGGAEKDKRNTRKLRPAEGTTTEKR